MSADDFWKRIRYTTPESLPELFVEPTSRRTTDRLAALPAGPLAGLTSRSENPRSGAGCAGNQRQDEGEQGGAKDEQTDGGGAGCGNQDGAGRDVLGAFDLRVELG